MMRTSLRRHGSTALVLAALLIPLAASAAPGIAPIPVGQSVRYHITTNTSKPELAGGSSSSSHYVLLTRRSPTSFGVMVDGAPSGSIFADPYGGLNIPPNLQAVLKPFGIVAKLMRGTPNPMSSGSGWAASVPVPVRDTTDNVTTFVRVTSIGPGGISLVANGQNATDVQTGLRDHNAQVNVNASMQFNPHHVLTNAGGTISVQVREGVFRSKNVSENWSITLVP